MKIYMETFGVTEFKGDISGEDTAVGDWEFWTKWGTDLCGLVYCPEPGWLTNITALVSKGNKATCCAMPGIYKIDSVYDYTGGFFKYVGTHLPTSPYWYQEHQLRTTLLAHGELKTV